MFAQQSRQTMFDGVVCYEKVVRIAKPPFRFERFKVPTQRQQRNDLQRR